MNAVQTETVRQFILCATAFCALLEDHCAYSSHQFVREVARFLLELDKLGLSLSAVDAPALEIQDIPADSIQWIARNMVDKVGKVQFYQDIANPFDFEKPSPVRGDIADDLTAVYRDLKRGLLTAREDQSVALRYWKLTFSHWGLRSVNALRALHWIITEDLLSK